ncbi:MAG: hypothetical protein HKO57_05680 [Akkermansiaceae bacterium]|nr:hypothetical protein [Akkermansiaceae bacterium]
MSALLYLLPLGLIFDLAGYLPPSLRLLLLYALLALPLCLYPSRRAAWLGGGLLLLMVVRAVVPLPPVAEILLFVIVHQAIWTGSAVLPRSLQAGVVAYSVVHVFLFLSPLGHPVLEAMAGTASRIAGGLTGSSYKLGWTYQNLGAFLLFLSLSVFSAGPWRVALMRTGIFVVVALLLNTLAAALMIEKVDFGAEFAWELEYRDAFGFEQLAQRLRNLVVLVVPGLLFLAYLLAYFFLHYDRAAKGGAKAEPAAGVESLRDQFRIDKRAVALAGAGAVLILLVVPPTSLRRPAARELVFVEKGVVSYSKPEYGRYGRAAGGMFGLLPDYARLFGCEASVVKEIPESLDPAQVLVLTNLDVDVGEEVRQRIWKFVEDGGGLWILGDHTFIKNGRNHLNDLLAPYHIRFQNDSAQFFPQGWFHSYRFRQGTPFATLRDDAENRPGILVGASLDLQVPAEPFVIGRFGYSDWGLEVPDEEQGHLGDFEYQPSERLGDLVLVAGERSGKGRVLVVGDTSSFFANNMSRSYELLRACLSWSGQAAAWSFPASWPGRIMAVLLLGGFCALVFKWRSAPVLLPALATVMVISLLGHGSGGLLRFDRETARKRMALIDFAHQPLASKHSSMGNGLHGVTINFARYGLLPVTINDWDRAALDAAGFVVLNAPRRPFSAGQRRDLTEFMERGGVVILACGYQQYDHCRDLLAPHGIAVGGVPLGRFFDRPAFGQPVSFLSAWPLEVRRDDAAVLCVYDQWPLMVSVPVGDGKLVVIGDSEFLHNRNLEGHENHDPANTAFIKNLLDHLTK